MRQSKVMTFIQRGVDALPVTIEVSVENGGLPGFHLVGMTGNVSAAEIREVMRCALRATGFTFFKYDHVVVQVSPAIHSGLNVNHFAFPLAVAYLAATEQIDPKLVRDAAVVGELALDGSVRPCGFELYNFACKAAELGKEFISGNITQLWENIEGLNHETIGNLLDLRTLNFSTPHVSQAQPVEQKVDFSDLRGLDAAIRLLAIAVAGHHNVLIIGPNASAKSMLASRIKTILPKLDDNERQELLRIYSAANADPSEILAGVRPVRHPHHSAAVAGLIGGGKNIFPGEVSLAHNGVLLLEDIQEFAPSALKSACGAAADKTVRLARCDVSVELPCDTQIIATANSCPCGYFGSTVHDCSCPSEKIMLYQQKLLKKMQGVFDIAINLSDSASYDCPCCEPSVVLSSNISDTRKLLADCDDTGAEELLSKLVSSMKIKLDARGERSVISVARTIASYEQSREVTTDHLTEALSVRSIV